ncbi:hypothetical protein AB0I69_47030 [Streptomyces sp. NPDC050508]|uniref:hypothetical protein n=1 Tax=Streptomyces sp. NPDC050508 TaxID=3155405 RepID=UPI003421FCDA
MSRETDTPSSGPDGRGGAAYPSGTPPYGTPAASDDRTDAGRSAAQPEERKTETTLTTRIRINIPGSRPIPPVVVRTPVADTEGSTTAEVQLPSSALPEGIVEPTGELALPGAEEKPSDWFAPRKSGPAKGGQGGGGTNGAGIPGGSAAGNLSAPGAGAPGAGAPGPGASGAPGGARPSGGRPGGVVGAMGLPSGSRPGGANGGTNGAGFAGATGGGPVAPGHGGGTGSFDVTEALAAGPLGNGSRPNGGPGEPRRDELPYFAENGQQGGFPGPGGQSEQGGYPGIDGHGGGRAEQFPGPGGQGMGPGGPGGPSGFNGPNGRGGQGGPEGPAGPTGGPVTGDGLMLPPGPMGGAPGAPSALSGYADGPGGTNGTGVPGGPGTGSGRHGGRGRAPGGPGAGPGGPGGPATGVPGGPGMGPGGPRSGPGAGLPGMIPGGGLSDDTAILTPQKPAPGPGMPGYGAPADQVSGHTVTSGMPVVPGAGNSPFGPGTHPDGPLPHTPPKLPEPGSAQSAPAAAKNTGKSAAKKKKGRSKLVLLCVGVIVIGGGAYCAGLLMNHTDVPKGTTVLGVDIGGGTRDDAVKKLDDAFGGRVNKPLKLSVGGKTVSLKPDQAGLQFDFATTVSKAATSDYNPVSVIGSLFGQHRVIEPEMPIDEEKLQAALADLGGGSGSGAVTEGTIQFTSGKAVAVYGKAGKAIDAAGSTGAVGEAYRAEVETGTATAVTVPTTTKQPTVTNAEVDREMKAFAQPAMSAKVTVQTDAAHSVLMSPQNSLWKFLKVSAVDGKLVDKPDLTALKDLYGQTFDGVLISRANGKKTAVTPEDVYLALRKALTSTSNRVAVIDTNPS